jgi:phage tail-like protein
MAATSAPTDRSTAPGSRNPDPAGELRFLVDIGGVPVGRFSECGGLSMEYEILEYQEGGRPEFTHKLRGQLKYPNLTLKRGVTHESALLDWFFRAQTPEERPVLTVSLVGADSKAVRHWSFVAAFPVKWQGPALNAGSNNIATETLEIAHAGLARGG